MGMQDRPEPLDEDLVGSRDDRGHLEDVAHDGHAEHLRPGKRAAQLGVGHPGCSSNAAEDLAALLRSSMTSDEGARVLREFLSREVFGRIAAATGVPDPELRGSLAGAQMLGLAVMRYILKVPALVDVPHEVIVERLGPVLQAHLMDTPATEG